MTFLDENMNKIICGDCLDVLKKLPDKCVDLILTDPPYGIGFDGQKKQFCKNPKHNRKEHIKKDWDFSIPPKKYFNEILRISKKAIIWGGIILMSICRRVTRGGLFGIKDKMV